MHNLFSTFSDVASSYNVTYVSTVQVGRNVDQFSAHMYSMWTDEIASAEMNWLIVSPETLQRAEKSTMMPPGFPLNSKS